MKKQKHQTGDDTVSKPAYDSHDEESDYEDDEFEGE